MPLTQEQLESIRDEYFADDVPVLPSMARWQESAVRDYFESGGEIMPAESSDKPQLEPQPTVDAPASASEPPDPEPASRQSAPEPAAKAVDPRPAPLGTPHLLESDDEQWTKDALLARLLAASSSKPPVGATGLLCATGRHEWANCALLQPLLSALMPEAELEKAGVLLLDVATARLLTVGDAEQQCEALLQGPQCQQMRRRLRQAALVLALVNDAEEDGAGSHWSAVAWRRARWRDGVFALEHYDPSGDVELNADAAGLFGSALAERMAEICEADVDRTEVWRMPAPEQHNADVCGLSAAAFAYALYLDHIGASGSGGGGKGGDNGGASSPARGAGGKLVTPATLRALGWREVEGLRRAAGALWGSAEVIAAAQAYGAELAAEGKAPARLCSQRCEVVFDIYDDDDAAECQGAEAAQIHKLKDQPACVVLAALLDGLGVATTLGEIVCRSTTIGACTDLVRVDRPALLRHLKTLGVGKLQERQAIANAISKHSRNEIARAG